MERQVLSKKISAVQNDLSRLGNTLYAMDSTDIQRYPGNYETLSTDAALRAEKITCALRHLVYSTTQMKKSEYLEKAGEAQGIEVENENGTLTIRLPSLLPKRKRSKSSEFLTDALYFSLQHFSEEHPIPLYRQCVICFSQVYDQSLPMQYVRDYDNIEFKQALDVIIAFFCTDDNGLLCDAYNTAEMGEENCTRIYVMGQERFPMWLSGHKSSLKTISDFTENSENQRDRVKSEPHPGKTAKEDRPLT